MKRTSKRFAAACIERYKELYGTTIDPDQLLQAYTESVSFDINLTMDELTRLKANTNCDNVRLMFGVYVNAADFPEVDPRDYEGKEGRLTIFLWPHCGEDRASTFMVQSLANNDDGNNNDDDNDDAAPLNMGSVEP